MLISDAVHVWRDTEGVHHIEWQTSVPDTRVEVEPLLISGQTQVHYPPSGNTAQVSGLAPENRHLFLLRDGRGTEIVAAQRRLDMLGSPNFRDFGGYLTADGKQVKWGYLYRSGQLSGLHESDVAVLQSLALDLICDFRREEEQEMEPSRLPAVNTPRIASLPIVPGSNSRFFEDDDGQMGGAQEMFDFMVEINRDFAAEQTMTYSKMFREILALPDARFLVHCAAGKDRTGFAAALVLLALGVPREVVMRDYMLTRQYFLPEREVARLREKYAMEAMDERAIIPMLEVHEAYLARALETIDHAFPSLEAYLSEALGVGPAELSELRGRYLA